MAKTVDQFSTLEQFRQRYNDLATDVGDASGLVTDRKTTIVDAINSIEEKTFYFQEFIYTATANQTSFKGQDDFENTLRFRRNKIQVFVDTDLLYEDTDYTIADPDGNAHEEIQLIGSFSSGLSAGQKLTVFSFTGSFLGTDIADALVGYFSENDDGTIYNTNDLGVILNPSSLNATTVLSDPSGDGAYAIEAAGNLYVQDKLRVENESDFDGNVDITGNLDITGNVTIDAAGDLTIKDGSDNNVFTVDGANGNVVLAGNITVGDADADNVIFNADINSDFIPNVDNTYDLGTSSKEWQDLYLDGTAYIDDLQVHDAAKLYSADLTVYSDEGVTETFDVDSSTGNTAIAGTLDVDSHVGIDGNLDINTDKFTVASSTGNTAIAGTLGVDGATSLDDSLTVTGATQLNGGLTMDTDKFTVADTTGNTAIAGTLEVTGATELNGGLTMDTDKFVVADTTGNTSIAGTLEVTGGTSLNGGLTMDTDKFVVADGTGNTAIAGTLDVTDDVAVNTDKFTVASSTGNTAIAGTLGVDGTTSLNGDVNLGDNATDTVTITGSLDGHLNVLTDSTYNLGSDTKRFATTFSDTLRGTNVGTSGDSFTTGYITTLNSTTIKGADLQKSDGTVVVDVSAATFAGEASTVGALTGNDISGLDNVNDSARTNGYLLTWEESSSSWVAAAPPEDGVLSVTAGEGLSLAGGAQTPTLDVNAGAGIAINSDNVVLDYEIVNSTPTDATGTTTGHLWFVVEPA